MPWWTNEPVYCKACGKKLPDTKKYGAMYCDQNCRKAASRRKQQPQKIGIDLVDRMQEFRRLVKDDPDLAADVVEWVKRIKGECQDLLILFDKGTAADMAALGDMMNHYTGKRGKK